MAPGSPDTPLSGPFSDDYFVRSETHHNHALCIKPLSMYCISTPKIKLAKGFPGSVTPDYVPFQMWDTLQGLSTYIRAMLSTQALLGAIGVGEKSATVIGATFQWFLRDLTGMLGGILFAFYQGSNLDSNAKMWRLVADFMNDLGMLMDLLSPLFPSSLIVIMCLGSLSRSFTGVASGATRAALTQHFALANNAADISAKEHTQLFRKAARRHLQQCLEWDWDQLASKKLSGVKFVVSGPLLAAQPHLFFACCESSLIVLPNMVSKQEHILPFWSSWRKLLRVKLPHELVHLGAKASMLTHSDMLLIAKTRSYYTNANYFLLDKDGSVCIFIHKQAVATDVLKSFIHGLVLARFMQKSKSCHTEAHQWMDEKYNTFISKLKVEGYSTERLLSHSIVWKAHWVYGPLAITIVAPWLSPTHNIAVHVASGQVRFLGHTPRALYLMKFSSNFFVLLVICGSPMNSSSNVVYGNTNLDGFIYKEFIDSSDSNDEDAEMMMMSIRKELEKQNEHVLNLKGSINGRRVAP
ncbi:hypothetical protein TRIUR3_24734 [Triticum urartu]|uniref:Uncharacterized protein n=1 Tax=Triticum urartu TaxID=4572 RepID=M7ZDL1_TRIUA|nr:hypothetical protein TRIUR3_24734 [Triticum urartu]